MTSDYFSVHTHSEFSGMDGMGSVQGIVDRVVELGQPGLVLSDHGTMGGSVQGYKACMKAGLAFYPACEFYVVRDVQDPDTRSERFHLGMGALDLKGYQALTRLSTLSWQEDRFYRKPLIDLGDLAYMHSEGYMDHIFVTTGCFFGLVIDRWQGATLDIPQRRADSMIAMLKKWCPHLYVEVQNHNVQHDDGFVDDLFIASNLYDLAQKHSLPMVVGGDSHYIHAHEQPVHDLMKDICYHGDGDDFHFPGGPYHLLSSDEAMGAFPASMRNALEEGHEDLLNKNALRIPPLDKYKFHVPKMYDDPQDVLRAMAYECLAAKDLDSMPYRRQLDHELHVIDQMKMSNYFLLVKTHVTDWCRDNGIIVNARGSVNGSLLTFLLGISNVDPLVWHTSFPRFLSLDRMKPPDIDIDVDFRGRRRLIEHLRVVFPTMVQVGTYAKIGITSSEADDGTGEDTGSVYVQYMAAMRRKVPDFDGRVLPQHRAALNLMAETPINKSMGTNAAGFILPGDNLAIADYLPLARIISSKTTLTQFNKDDVEAFGYMKMDVLGIRALQTLNGTLVKIGKTPNEWDWIPYDDKDACKILRSGNGIGIFQFEGWSTAKGGKELGIKNTLDVVLCLALYRPALMNGGQKDLYLANRGKARANQVRLHPIFDPVLKDTAGVPLFQEQIMEILKAVGMGYADWNDLMTAVKASNGFIQGAAKTFDRVQPIFYDLCEDAGLDAAECDAAWGAIMGFTEYGFNRAHSTGYALMSYYGAYLKAHYPLEYMASAMDVWAGEKKEPEYVQEARRLGFTVVRPDVNFSSASWDIDPSRKNALRKGLVSLKGVGWNVAEAVVQAREEGGPFTSMQDFIDRTPRRPVTGGADYKRTGELKGVCLTMYEANAFRSINP